MKYRILRDKHTDKRHCLIFDVEVGPCIRDLGSRFVTVGAGTIELEKATVYSEGELGDLLEIMTHDHFSDASEVN